MDRRQCAEAGHWGEQIEAAHAETVRLRDSALALVSDTVRAGIRAGNIIEQARGTLSTEEWTAWLSKHAPSVDGEQSRRYQLVAKRARQATELTNGLTRQIYMDLELMPGSDYVPPPPEQQQKPPDWVRWASRIDAHFGDLTQPQRVQLRMWCQQTLRRLA